MLLCGGGAESSGVLLCSGGPESWAAAAGSAGQRSYAAATTSPGRRPLSSCIGLDAGCLLLVERDLPGRYLQKLN
jgi:hypothetical protein